MAGPPRPPTKERSSTQDRLVDALRESVVISPSSSYQPTHHYTRSSPKAGPPPPPVPMSRRVMNPFEEDEIEPEGDRLRPPGLAPVVGVEASGEVTPTRAKFSRASTGNNAAAVAAPALPYQKIRRSMSSDSYGTSSTTTLAATQLQANKDKKGSRHADVIDTWDPTGMGSAMWHHSGPYDAAAPSRNVNLPKQKAPMQAFLPPVDAPAQGPSGSNGPAHAQAPPPPPAKSPGHSQRAQSALRHGAQRTRSSGHGSGGGLSGQYSTSMPSSGGYFPQAAAEDDEHERARKEREREREAKRRALKAAWGIDEPEPFEDFGASPGHEDVDLNDDYFNEAAAAQLAQAPSKTARSPGFRLSGVPRTPPVSNSGQYAATNEAVAPIDENEPIVFSGQAGGVKRSKSLMQKIKSMRENPNVPLGNGAARPRSNSPFSARRNGSGGSTTPNDRSNPSPSYDSKAELLADEDEAISPIEASGSTHSYALVDSPSSKDRARQALSQERKSSVSRVKDKNLPVPPVAPVFPDFAEEESGVQAQLPRVAQVQQDSSVNVRRKPSLASKLKGKIAGRS